MTSRWLFLANLLMVGLASFFVVSLLLEVSRPRGLPPARAPRHTVSNSPPDGLPPPASVIEHIETFNVIVAKNLFNESRKERAIATARATVPPLPKPILHGVVVDGPSSLAYLEDPTSKRVVGYRVGAPIAGGLLLQITQEGVAIRRPDGQVEVLLNDPSKSKLIQERVTAPPEERPAATGSTPQAPPAIRRTPKEPAPGPSQPPAVHDQN
jgi:hypothetical protein